MIEEEMRKFGIFDMVEYGRLESNEKTIAILGGSRRRNRTGIG